jgi:hypothetical protein
VADAPLERVNRMIRHHGEISRALTVERTALESQLIPVSAYIVIAAAECWHRYPEMVDVITAAMRPEEIGHAGRRPGMRVNSVHLWSVANIYLTGRKALSRLAPLGVGPPFRDDPDRTWRVLDFADRAARAYRGDGHTLAADAGNVLRPYGEDIVKEMMDAVTPVGDDDRVGLARFLATLYNYLFLLYFDTRVGTGDTGPYLLPDGRTLLVRDFYWLGPSDFPWSTIAAGVPYQNLTAALVLDDVRVMVNDWGTSVTDPESYLDRLVGFALFTTDGGTLRALERPEMERIVDSVRRAQAAHYRNIAAMDRNQKIDAGVYVYFTFLRPFAEVARVADDLDWRVPQATAGPLYDLVATIEWSSMPAEDPSAPYYDPIEEVST